MSVWALVPTKGFDRAKSRLSEVMSPVERAELARELFEHVITTLRRTPTIDSVAVVSDSEAVRGFAEDLDLLALADAPDAATFAEVIDEALHDLTARGASSAVICMSDLPDLEQGDVESVVGALSESDVVLVPDRSGDGTNVIAMAPATVLPSCLGHVDSFARHMALAYDLGLTVGVQVSDGMAFDVDQPSDLDRLRTR